MTRFLTAAVLLTSLVLISSFVNASPIADKIIKWNNQPVILLAVHGSVCNGSGVRKCYQAYVWSEGALRSVGEK